MGEPRFLWFLESRSVSREVTSELEVLWVQGSYGLRGSYGLWLLWPPCLVQSNTGPYCATSTLVWWRRAAVWIGGKRDEQCCFFWKVVHAV